MKKYRKNRIEVRLSNEELMFLNSEVAKTGLSREEYLRALINKVVPANKPTNELVEVIKQLRMIGNNLNQIAVIAYKTSSIDIMKYKHESEKLQEEILKIMKSINQSRPLEES
ncbi:MAG: plasmid mobilization relaxosome protein MobC [Thomasclavelia ramosa]|nr:plasmid mobilization relaxosome protein MobC [Thomasclavelia ramosa]